MSRMSRLIRELKCRLGFHEWMNCMGFGRNNYIRCRWCQEVK